MPKTRKFKFSQPGICHVHWTPLLSPQWYGYLHYRHGNTLSFLSKSWRLLWLTLNFSHAQESNENVQEAFTCYALIMECNLRVEKLKIFFWTSPIWLFLFLSFLFNFCFGLQNFMNQRLMDFSLYYLNSFLKKRYTWF